MPLAFCFWVFLISLDFRIQIDFSWANISSSLLGLNLACLLAYNPIMVLKPLNGTRLSLTYVVNDSRPGLLSLWRDVCVSSCSTLLLNLPLQSSKSLECKLCRGELVDPFPTVLSVLLSGARKGHARRSQTWCQSPGNSTIHTQSSTSQAERNGWPAVTLTDGTGGPHISQPPTLLTSCFWSILFSSFSGGFNLWKFCTTEETSVVLEAKICIRQTLFLSPVFVFLWNPVQMFCSWQLPFVQRQWAQYCRFTISH